MKQASTASLNRRALSAAIGLALATSAAHADTFSVTTNASNGSGSFRAALNQANAAAGPHTLDFSAIAGETITLASNLPEITEDLTLQGSDVTLSGDGQYACLAADGADLTVNSMTVTQCVASVSSYGGQTGQSQDRGISGPAPEYAGGGIRAAFGDVTINDSTITGNTAPYAAESYYGVGGGVAVKYGRLEVNNSTISNNSAYGGGGIYTTGPTRITDSVIADNTSAKYGGGIAALAYGPSPADVRGVQASLVMEGTTISGNSSEGGGGAFVLGSLSMTESEVTGNDADLFAGLLAITPPESGLPPHEVVDSSIADNSAYYAYGGMTLFGSSRVSGTTISGNQAGYYAGGAFLSGKYSDRISAENSTISGNSAGEGAGLVIYGEAYEGGSTQVSFTGMTITGNTAADGFGGGVLALPSGGEITFQFGNSIIAGNASAQGSADLTASLSNQVRGGAWTEWRERLSGYRDRGTSMPGDAVFEVAFSLLGEAPDSGSFNPVGATSSLLGSDPQLGSLADNGGPTLTHLPADTSPAVNAIAEGSGGCGTTFSVDQRGQPRPQGSGCDIGSVEGAGAPIPPPTPINVPVLDRIGLLVLTLGAGLLGLFGLGRRRRQQG